MASSSAERLQIAMFITCFNDTFFPGVGRATVDVLRRLGHTVEFPIGQTCCGQMHNNTGYPHEAELLARNFVKVFSPYAYIVSPSASCVATVRTQYAQIAQRSTSARFRRQAVAVAERTYELSEFLVDVLGVTDVGAYFPHRVTYHPTCHSLRLLHVGNRPLQLLQEVRALELLNLADASQCCGFGGTFAIKNPDISTAMLNDKLGEVLQSGAEVVTAIDSSCLAQIGGGLSRQRAGIRTMHLAEILACTENLT